MKDSLGNRIKENFEQRTRYYLPRRTYTIIRLDGKCFKNFTRGLDKPFDKDLIKLMDKTTSFLCEKIQGCEFGYTQSDEISLLLTDFNTINTDAWFNGNIQKICSIAASMATYEFNIQVNNFINTHRRHKFLTSDGTDKIALFDARVFTIPDIVEVENYFIWRQKDAIKNSISMLAQSLYSHKELQSKSQLEMIEMIKEKGENWEELDNGIKYGRTILNKNSKGWYRSFNFLEQRDILTSLVPVHGYNKT